MYLSIIYYGLIFELLIVLVLFVPNIITQRKIASFISACLKYQYVLIITIIFYMFVIMIAIDSYIEMTKYTSIKDFSLSHHENENINKMKLFRAQRNVYLTIFTLFTGLIINRTLSLIRYQH